MNSKIFFSDLDGTLLNDHQEITAGNQAAISEALAAGHKIVIATGRPLASARIQAERLKLTGEGCYAITYNGGLIYDSAPQHLRSERTARSDFCARTCHGYSHPYVFRHTYPL